uniref:Uncharacterized protein n=2 Tax=Arion vulgaris TaxID=1028688 RepID=A0A0B6Z0V1_9EUPU
MSRCWESSPHVSHFHRHPDEYVDAVLNFLEHIGMTKPEAMKNTQIREIKKKSQEATKAL